MQANKLYNSVDAAEYLKIPLEEFLEHTNYKATLCYLLRNGQRLYKQSELNRFKQEVLDVA